MYLTFGGYKIAIKEATLSNTGTAAADESTTVTFDLYKILDVLALVRKDGNNSGVYATVSGNTVTVTAQSVPAGSSTTVRIVVVGY